MFGEIFLIIWTIIVALVVWGLTKSATKKQSTTVCRVPKDCDHPTLQDCINNECIYVCKKGQQCPDGYQCFEGKCYIKCTNADDTTTCGSNYACQEETIDEDKTVFMCKKTEAKESQEGEEKQDFGNVWLSYFILSVLIFILPIGDFFSGSTIQKYVGNNWNKYFSHVWLCSIIGMYTSGVHHFMLGSLSPMINIGITTGFSILTFIFTRYILPSNYSYLFQEIYSLFDYLFLSKQLSFINVALFVIWAGFAYNIYTKERYSKNYDKKERHQCNWHMPDNDELDYREEKCNTSDTSRKSYQNEEGQRQPEGTSVQNKLVIVLGWFVFVIYPFILYWRTYSLENTLLVENRAPLIFFGIGMFILFIDLFFSGLRKSISKMFFTKSWRDSSKKLSEACPIDKTCKEVGVTDYPASIGFNYIIWMCVGLICESFAIFLSKNKVVKNRGIAHPGQAFVFFFKNFGIIFFHCLSTIFGGESVWNS
jgi:hypothetical protein